jgi:hypothetical protein
MIQRGKTELVFLLEHPEVDILEQAIVEISWIYVPERRPSLDDDYGEPYDFTYEVEVTVNLSGCDFYTNSYCTRNSRRVNGYYKRSFKSTVFSELKYFGLESENDIIITKIKYESFE